jgi:hypothetical protein
MSAASFIVYMLAHYNYIPGYETKTGDQAAQSLSKQQVYCDRLQVGPGYESGMQALAFLILTTMQILQVFFSRSIQNSVFRTGVLGNRWMIGASLSSFLALVGGIYIPGKIPSFTQRFSSFFPFRENQSDFH